jgi:hypothetical protein
MENVDWIEAIGGLFSTAINFHFLEKQGIFKQYIGCYFACGSVWV